MPSAHYGTVAACLGKSMEDLGGASGEVKPEDLPLWNISNALLALSDALQDEFIAIHTRLDYLTQRLGRNP